MSNPAGRRLEGLGLRYGDVEAGDWFDTPEHRLTAGDIDRFADLTGDRFDIHMSDAAARELGFPGRVAHGLLVLSIVDGLKNNSAAGFDAIASLGWEWRFERPVLIGDSIHARITVVTRRETRQPDRGILQLDFEVMNGDGAKLQSGRNQLMVRR